MTDVAREKYQRLMKEIDDLETRVDDLTEEIRIAADSPNPQDKVLVEQELRDLNEQLTAKRNELARISDGCGPGRSQG